MSAKCGRQEKAQNRSMEGKSGQAPAIRRMQGGQEGGTRWGTHCDNHSALVKTKQVAVGPRLSVTKSVISTYERAGFVSGSARGAYSRVAGF